MIVPPAVFGHELAGVISEVYPNIDNWRPGEHVVVANSAPCGQCFYCEHDQENLCEDLLFLNGAYAQSIVVSERLVRKNLLRLRAGTRFEDAALTEPLACVVHAFEETELIRGERLLIIGSGPIGLMFARLATHAGIVVTVAGRGQARLAAASRLGAARTVQVEPSADLVEVIQRSAKTSFDVVIEAVGKPETWEAAVELTRKGGRVNFFGGCPAGSSISLDTGRIHYSNLKLLASFHHTPKTLRIAFQLIEDGLIQSTDFVDGACHLDDLPLLFQSMAQGNRAVKTVINVGSTI